MDKSRKKARYERVHSQLKELFESTDEPLARASTAIALLHHKFDYFYWTGIYHLIDENLIVGPYQGTLACMKLEKGKGVCWHAVTEGQTVIVENVHEFPGHIACDSRSNSEIVVPIRNRKGEIAGVLDVDSTNLAAFCEEDQKGLEKIIALIAEHLA